MIRNDLHSASQALQLGELVVFPTETVYGLGANALDPIAVAKIYEVKGRPLFNPLIVHAAEREALRPLVKEVPDAAMALASAFWPGPLTLVLPKSDAVPDIVCAGLPTVAVRVPRHPVALDLLRQAGVPIAAPSANRFTEVSPTLVEHARKSLEIGSRITSTAAPAKWAWNRRLSGSNKARPICCAREEFLKNVSKRSWARRCSIRPKAGWSLRE